MMKDTKDFESIIADNGQRVSNNAIFEAASRTVAAYIKRTGHFIPKDDIDDIIQETVANALEAWKSYDPSISSVETWTDRIAYHCICDYWDGRAKREGWGYDKISSYSDNQSHDIEGEYCTYSIGTKGAPSLENLYADSDPLDDMLRTEKLDWLHSHIDRLPDRSKRIVELYCTGMKPAQIADELECTSNAVSITLHRAIKALMKMAENEHYPAT